MKMNKHAELKNLPVEQLSRGRFQPRRVFDEQALIELTESIEAQGVIEPIVVRKNGDLSYEIIAGERRWRAAQRAGFSSVPCVIRQYTDEEAAEVTLIENIQRENLNPIEEAKAIFRLIEDFCYTHEAVAKAIGKSRTKITNMLRLLNLDERVQQCLIQKQLSEGHGKTLAGLPFEHQWLMAEAAINGAWSVRQLELESKQQKLMAGHKKKDKKDANIARLEKLASARFGSEVVVENNADNRSGWIKLKYQNYEVLSGILEKMGVDEE